MNLNAVPKVFYWNECKALSRIDSIVTVFEVRLK